MMLYVHIPFCKGKCIYCDFYSGGNPDWQKYLNALVNECSERIGEIDGSISSIYIGGGTPSLIPPRNFSDFIYRLKSLMKDNGIALSSRLEFTVEVNPEDVDADHIDAWRGSAVNRISMGVQSLIDSELRFLRRRHDAGRAAEAVSQLMKHFSNISLDLIYGIPGQTEDSLRESLKRMLDLRPQHISAYALTYEEGTPLHLFQRQGKVTMLSDEEYVRYGRIVEGMLTVAGYGRYEISNFSLPSFHSRHNSGYWKGRPYLGIGPSASSYDGDRVRRTNPADLRRYIARFENGGEEPFYEEERLDDEQLRIERLMVALRTAQGVQLPAYGQRFGDDKLKSLLGAAERWIASGRMARKGDHLRLTSAGWEISDHILLSLL